MGMLLGNQASRWRPYLGAHRKECAHDEFCGAWFRNCRGLRFRISIQIQSCNKGYFYCGKVD